MGKIEQLSYLRYLLSNALDEGRSKGLIVKLVFSKIQLLLDTNVILPDCSFKSKRISFFLLFDVFLEVFYPLSVSVTISRKSL